MVTGIIFFKNLEDYNGDDKTDIFLRNRSTGGNAVLLMDGTTATATGALPGLSSVWNAGGLGDYNSDGKTDWIWRNGSTGENVVWLMDGTTIASATPCLDCRPLG